MFVLAISFLFVITVCMVVILIGKTRATVPFPTVPILIIGVIFFLSFTSLWIESLRDNTIRYYELARTNHDIVAMTTTDAEYDRINAAEAVLEYNKTVTRIHAERNMFITRYDYPASIDWGSLDYIEWK